MKGELKKHTTVLTQAIGVAAIFNEEFMKEVVEYNKILWMW